MPIDPHLRSMMVYSTASLTATIAVQLGPLSNAITIRRFVEGCSANASSGTTALNIDDGGTAGTGTTAVCNKSTAVVTVAGAVTEAENTGAADGYKLAAGNCLIVNVTQATATITGYTLVMEYVDGIG